MSSKIYSLIESELKVKINSVRSVGGGCISNAEIITDNFGNTYFLKTNINSPPDMFFKEANGLNELIKASAIRIPKPILINEKFLLMENIKSSSKSKNFDENFGRAFARLHKYAGKEFGFYEDNYIGSTPQKNISDSEEKIDWIKFYLNKRILFQFNLLEKAGYSDDKIRKGISYIEDNIENILEGSENIPSLLHGDLWSGNYITDDRGEACLIDPAVYYGNREADLAMTKLFGGFSSTFYKSYQEEFPLPDGYDYRENIYKLYHVMNHLNLFGGGYYHQTISLLNFYRK